MFLLFSQDLFFLPFPRPLCPSLLFCISLLCHSSFVSLSVCVSLFPHAFVSIFPSSLRLFLSLSLDFSRLPSFYLVFSLTHTPSLSLVLFSITHTHSIYLSHLLSHSSPSDSHSLSLTSSRLIRLVSSSFSFFLSLLHLLLLSFSDSGNHR